LLALKDEFGSAEDIVKTPTGELRQSQTIGETLRNELALAIENADLPKIASDLQTKGIDWISIVHDEYPDRLREIPDPPLVLFVLGESKLLDTLSIAIVGSRKATKYGAMLSERIAYDLAELGITIISGMALGIDGASHTGALAAHGRTVAVLGSGVDVIYPSEHKDLYSQIVENGAVVSEYLTGTEPKAYHFPERNRIISGLAHAVIVVEAPRKSGALITASVALEQGREVFAVPGLITNPASRGCHHLIKSGQAALIENADDVLSALKISKQELLYGKPAPAEQMSFDEKDGSLAAGDAERDAALARKNEAPAIAGRGKGYTSTSLEPLERKVLDRVSYEGTHINEIARSTGLTIADLSAILTMLEIKGIVTTSSGGFYQRI
jgi:DNA processing protein